MRTNGATAIARDPPADAREDPAQLFLELRSSPEGLSGREAYQRYGATAFQHVTARGGGIVWAGPQALVFIGGPEQDWDDIICVKYPSRQKFLEMISDPAYLAATYHRDAGLERTALICCKAGSAA